MTNKLKIQNGLSGRITMVLAFAILTCGIAAGTVGYSYGVGQTRGINPDTGRPHGEQPIRNSYDAGKVDSFGMTLEPTKILKREVVPSVQYPEQSKSGSAKTAPKGKPITLSVPVPARSAANVAASNPKPAASQDAPKATAAKSDAKPVASQDAPKATAVKSDAKPAASQDAPKATAAKSDAKPAVSPNAKTAIAESSKTTAGGQKTDPASTKPSLLLEPAKQVKDLASSVPKPQAKTASDPSSPKAEASERKVESQAVAETPMTPVSPTTPAGQAVEWAMSGWKKVAADRDSLKQSIQSGAKTWSVARAVNQKDVPGLVPSSAKSDVPAARPETPAPAPFPSVPAPSSSGKSGREAFLTQLPKPLPNAHHSTGAPRGPAKSAGISSAPAVNYGGKLEGIETGPNDIVLTDAIVEIPKGAGFEAMISACGQGLLVELGIEETGKDGKPVLDQNGQPKRISLKRGMAVRKGQILGKQNDREHAANKLVAEQQLLVAKKEAEKQLEIEVARLAVQVAESEYLRAQSANEKVPGAVSPEEVVQRAYEWKRADKSAEKASYDLDIKADEVEVRKAQVVAADAQVLDRKLVSPIDGFVDDVMQNEGQWLREGDNILKIIRLDKVQICGKIDANLFSPEMVDRKSVTIYVQKPGGPLQKVRGTITYARQVVESGKFYIYAEADNVANAQGYWLLNPGTIVTMVIHR